MGAKSYSAAIVFGGSFNPVHLAHVELINNLSLLDDSEQVLVVPARLSPFKGGKPTLPEALRLKMVQAALGGLAGVSVLDLEMRRPPPSYTLETLQTLQSLYPAWRMRLAMGWDCFGEFRQWKNALEILNLVELLVIPRAGSSTPAAEDILSWQAILPEGAPLLREMGANRAYLDDRGHSVFRLLGMELPEIASSQLLDQEHWELVPEPARPLLKKFLRENPRFGGDPPTGAP